MTFISTYCYHYLLGPYFLACNFVSRYEKEGKPSELADVDIFVSTVDPTKEPPLITANTVLSILAVDYPVDKVSCYVSDDGAAMLTFEALSETSEFAKKWVPFCKKFNIEPRAPEWYFAQKIDYLKDKVHPDFVRERRAMKVFLGHNGVLDEAGNELPRLVYVSREKRPGYDHHKKAGAMNSLGPIYVGTGCVFRRQALYGFDAPVKEKPPGKTCNCWPKWCCSCCGSKRRNRRGKIKQEKKKAKWAKHREASIQVHALESIDKVKGQENESSSLVPREKLEKKFGQSPVFVASTLLENGGMAQGVGFASCIGEAIHVISCGYEDRTEWGKEASLNVHEHCYLSDRLLCII
ncbi:hypothetical protein BHM03_00008232 [Ensete ventricosum]|nr:hypothetical protein BHM03_00008232 [Ensete ventricosum]